MGFIVRNYTTEEKAFFAPEKTMKVRARPPRFHNLARLAFLCLMGAVVASALATEAVPPGAGSEAARVKEILNKVDRLWRGSTSAGRMEMEVVTAHWSRTLRMKVYTEGMERSLVRITYPAKEEGVATLKVGNNIWNYLPKIKRVTKVPASMMLGSWMGSHFTNDDVVKDSQYVRDYETAITFEGKRDGQEILELTLHPKPEAPVVWGKIVSIIRAADYIPLSMTYFDEDGQAVRVLTFSGIKKMGGRTIPTVLTMRPLDKPKEYTRVTYLDITFDVDLKPGLFSLRSLQKTR
jgi:outer membrane lipoprotein-sorting protein